jgi:hypothetical protein
LGRVGLKQHRLLSCLGRVESRLAGVLADLLRCVEQEIQRSDVYVIAPEPGPPRE